MPKKEGTGIQREKLETAQEAPRDVTNVKIEDDDMQGPCKRRCLGTPGKQTGKAGVEWPLQELLRYGNIMKKISQGTMNTAQDRSRACFERAGRDHIVVRRAQRAISLMSAGGLGAADPTSAAAAAAAASSLPPATLASTVRMPRALRGPQARAFHHSNRPPTSFVSAARTIMAVIVGNVS